jgi:hypothetical protein
MRTHDITQNKSLELFVKRARAHFGLIIDSKVTIQMKRIIEVFRGTCNNHACFFIQTYLNPSIIADNTMLTANEGPFELVLYAQAAEGILITTCSMASLLLFL